MSLCVLFIAYEEIKWFRILAELDTWCSQRNATIRKGKEKTFSVIGWSTSVAVVILGVGKKNQRIVKTFLKLKYVKIANM